MHALLTVTFVAGYALIVCEQWTRVNKAAVALVTGVLAWVLLALSADAAPATAAQLAGHMGEISGILFFLLGAMTIVEIIDAHAGFHILVRCIRQKGKRSLLWVVALLAFFLSAVLDNLTTTIVAIAIVRKLVGDRRDRMLFAAVVVVAANAGGAWSPIGDVTTTMLWMGGQITSAHVVRTLLLPSLVCVSVVTAFVSLRLRGEVCPPAAAEERPASAPRGGEQMAVLVAGMLALVLVPAFKAATHLPPYMGMLLGLGVMWAITEFLHRDKDPTAKHPYSVTGALQRIDATVIMFFLGILLCIAALQSAGLLQAAGAWLAAQLHDDRLIVLATGLLSAVVDNVPLVAAVQRMYGLALYPTDHAFWGLLAYSVGTGGSILIVGSAAGVAAMGMERLQFWWYLRHVGWVALLGFLAGAACWLLQSGLS